MLLFENMSVQNVFRQRSSSSQRPSRDKEGNGLEERMRFGAKIEGLGEM